MTGHAARHANLGHRLKALVTIISDDDKAKPRSAHLTDNIIYSWQHAVLKRFSLERTAALGRASEYA
jgi:hypothetical protein